MRKLATIQKIESLSPIDGADQIVLAKILGWNCIVRKEDFNEGDLCLFFEVDSLIPEYKDLFFLARGGTKSVEIDNEIHTGYRIKTMRMKGVISQGLCLPITTAQKLMREATGLESSFELREGDDISCELNVYKYEKAIPLSMRGFAKGNFPKWFPKTDLERIQSHPGLIERHKDKVFVIQQKLDGQSQSIFFKDGEFGLCSRNLELKEHPGDSRWQVVRAMGIEEKMRAYGKNICIQGEFIGTDVQGNRLLLDGRTIIFFDVFDIDNQRNTYTNCYKIKYGYTIHTTVKECR
jgi:RNA ligase (TIGR02306 family)